MMMVFHTSMILLPTIAILPQAPFIAWGIRTKVREGYDLGLPSWSPCSTIPNHQPKWSATVGYHERYGQSFNIIQHVEPSKKTRRKWMVMVEQTVLADLSGSKLLPKLVCEHCLANCSNTYLLFTCGVQMLSKSCTSGEHPVSNQTSLSWPIYALFGWFVVSRPHVFF